MIVESRPLDVMRCLECSNEKEGLGDEKRKEKYTRDVAGRSDRDTLADRWTEEQPLLPTKPPEL